MKILNLFTKLNLCANDVYYACLRSNKQLNSFAYINCMCTFHLCIKWKKFAYKRRTSNVIIKAAQISLQQQSCTHLFVRYVYSICYGHKIFSCSFAFALSPSLILSLDTYVCVNVCVVLNRFLFLQFFNYRLLPGAH